MEQINDRLQRIKIILKEKQADVQELRGKLSAIERGKFPLEARGREVEKQLSAAREQEEYFGVIEANLIGMKNEKSLESEK